MVVSSGFRIRKDLRLGLEQIWAGMLQPATFAASSCLNVKLHLMWHFNVQFLREIAILFTFRMYVNVAILT